MELRAVSRKLSSCEQALEGHGAYLGIRDPVRKGESRCQVGYTTGYQVRATVVYIATRVACFYFGRPKGKRQDGQLRGGGGYASTACKGCSPALMTSNIRQDRHHMEFRGRRAKHCLCRLDSRIATCAGIDTGRVRRGYTPSLLHWGRGTCSVNTPYHGEERGRSVSCARAHPCHSCSTLQCLCWQTLHGNLHPTM